MVQNPKILILNQVYNRQKKLITFELRRVKDEDFENKIKRSKQQNS